MAEQACIPEGGCVGEVIAQFNAILTDSNCIKFSNDGSGKVTMDVDATEAANVVRLLLAGDRLLKVTVETV